MKIKNPDINDYEKIMRFLEDVYGSSHNSFLFRYPHIYKKEKLDYKNILIIEKDGKICSLVRIFPITTIQNGIEVKFGGIGSVSTSFEERGKGYMTILLNEAIKKMEKDGYPLSILWGDRHRYINFGYEIGGKTVILTITKRGLEKMKVSPSCTKRYLGEKEILLKVIEIYNKKKYRIDRDLEYFSLIYKKLNTALYYSEEGNRFGYVVIDTQNTDTRVYEFGGDINLILGILKYLSERFGKNSFILEFPNFEEIPEEILKASSYWNIVPTGMIKIISLRKTIETFKQLIEKEMEEGEDILFEIEGKERVGIKKEKGKIEFTEESKNIIKLKESDMVRLFFNINGFGIVLENRLKEKIKKFLPIEIFFPLLDHI